MKRIAILAVVSLLAILLGCGGGGGGGGGGTTLVGRVLSIVSGGTLNPAATVQQPGGSPSTTTDLTDGSFSLGGVPTGATQTDVLPNQSGWPAFSFTHAAASGNTVIGDLWVGPEQVTVRGRALNALTSEPITNVDVSFGGQNVKSNGTGVFNLTGVAYSSDTQTAFWGIVGTAVKTGSFLATEFTTAPFVKDGSGVVDIGDILLTPSDSNDPPTDPPYNITGRVLPIGGSTGTIVTLKQGSTALRIFNVGNNGKYFFWITPGTYEITYQKGSQTAPQQTVVLTQPNVPVTVPDVTLN